MNALDSYWSLQFAERPSLEPAASVLLRYVQKFPESDFQIDFPTFVKILETKTDSAPGPDGIPYSAWRYAPESVQKALFDAYSLWLQTGYLPPYLQ